MNLLGAICLISSGFCLASAAMAAIQGQPVIQVIIWSLTASAICILTLSLEMRR